MEDGSLELKKYWGLFLKWWWLFVLGIVGAVVAAYYVTSTAVPMYQSKVKVVVDRNELPGAPSAVDISISQDLAQNYVDLIKTRPILEQIADTLPVQYGPGALGSNITVTFLRNIITISASDPNPEMAAIIANTTADTFMRVLQDRQLSRLSQFQEVLNEFGIEQDDSIIAAQAAMIGILSILEPAIPAFQPSDNHMMRNLLVAAMVGFLASGLGVLLIVYLDGRVKSPEDLKKLPGLVSLGSIPRFKSRGGARVDLAASNYRSSPVLESYNLIWTNLEFGPRDNNERNTLLVTSSGISEGKTATAANLAISAAGQGKSVILVDSDLRKPSLQHVFDLGDHKGLTQLLTGEATLEEALASTPVEGLRVMVSGPTSSGLGTTLPSAIMSTIVQELKQNADLVIFDSPSLLAVGDATLLASLVDEVLLVVDVNKTSREALKEALDRLLQVKTHVVGAVLNKVTGPAMGGRYARHYRGDFEKTRGQASVLRLPSWPILSGIFLGSILVVTAVVVVVIGPQDIRFWAS